MRANIRSTKFSIIAFSLIYIVIGIMQLIDGADEDSMFYYFDNVFIHVMGALFIIASIGLLFRQEVARKAIIFLCILSISEIAITYDYSIGDKSEIIFILTLIFILYIIPIIFFLSSRSRNYFNSKTINTYSDDYDDYYLDPLDDSEIEMKNTKLGITSFILALLNILLPVSLVLLGRYIIAYQITPEELLTFSPMAIVIGLMIIINFISTFVGLGFGIVGLFAKKRDKTLAIWGIFLNLIVAALYITIIIMAITNYYDITPNTPPTQEI